jgi:acyl-coenzyme A thioesterase PaaI-like protein
MSTNSPVYPINSAAATYWQNRNALARAARQLNERLISSDIPAHAALKIAEDLNAITATLADLPQVSGLVEMSRRDDRGSVDNVMGELVAMAGRSHPCAPELSWQEQTDGVTGTVVFGQAFEGPPGHAHGGWVAGILDHLMGMTHVRTGRPGMTGGLSVKYRKPTPLNTPIQVSATARELDERRTEVTAEMRCGTTTTATAEAIFFRVDSARFGLESL